MEIPGRGAGRVSLVHEALEKAAREKQRKSALSGLAVPAKSPPAGKPMGETPKPHTTASAPAPPQPTKLPQTLLTIVISCVGLVAIVAIVYLVMRATATTPPAPAPDGGSHSSATVSTPAPPPATAPSGLGVSPRSAPSDNPAGETPAPPTPAADTAPYKLSGIMKDPEGKYCAVLNGRVVYEDHYVDGATIKKIERDRVTLDVNGRETVLRLF